MLKKNSKPMFFILLIPFYFLILICVFGMSVGGIDWLSALLSAMSMILAAWGLSRLNNLVINTIGLMFYAIMGGNVIYSTLTRTTRMGLWSIEVYTGIVLILFGLVPFVYNIIKSRLTFS